MADLQELKSGVIYDLDTMEIIGFKNKNGVISLNKDMVDTEQATKIAEESAKAYVESLGKAEDTKY